MPHESEVEETDWIGNNAKLWLFLWEFRSSSSRSA
jgi:hypothetical protein